MKPKPLNFYIAASVLLGGMSSSPATILHKADNTTTLQTTSSWTENLAPTSADTLVFDSTITSGPLNVSASYLQYAVGTLQFVDPAGNITLNWSGTSTAYQSSFVDMSNSTVDVTLSGGTLRIASATYNPTFNVASGRTLTVNSGLSNQGNTKTFHFTGAGNVVINSNSGSGGAMSFNVNGATVTMNNAASGWSAGTVTSGQLVIGSSAVLSGKRITNNAANGLAFGTGVTTASLGGLEGSGSFALENADTNAVALTIGSNNTNYTISGAISGAGALIKTGTGTQTFTVANSYAGGTSIEGGGVNLDSAAATLGGGTVTLSNGAILTMYRGNAADNASTPVFANDLFIASGQSGTVYNSPRGTWSGDLTGAGTLNLRVNYVRGDVTGDWSGFTGQVNVTARTGGDDFRIAAGGAGIGLNMAGGKLNLAAGVTMYQSVNPPSGTGTQTIHHIGELSGVAGSSIGGNPISDRFANWTVGALGTDSTYAGTINDGIGASRLTKVGTGTLTLSGTNTYTGETVISGGTLKLDATGSIDGSSGISVGNGGIFDVSAKSGYTVDRMVGSVNVIGAITVSTELAIGNSPGTASFSDDLTLGSSSTYTYELTGGGSLADLGDVAGNLTIAAGAILDLVQLGTYTANNKFTLFAYDGTLTGTFTGLADDSVFTDAGGDWMINYNDTTAGLNGGSGSSYVTVTAIPEPAAALLGGLGMLGLLRRRRN